MNILRRAVLATFFVLTLTASLVWGDDDPPGRVARLQYMTGSVSVQPHGTDDWVAGSVNRPLTASDNVWTDKSSRAELNFGGSVLRMNDETSATLTNVSDNLIQVQLHQGTVNLRVRKLFSGETYEVDTPNLAFTVQKSGEYRFDVNPDGDATVVIVRKGEGDATGDGPAVRIRSGEEARFTGGTSLQHEISRADSYDGFDDWCRVRFKREDRSVSARYVGDGVIGYEDLDDYGSWQVVPTYGSIWVPRRVAYGWAPYRYGHWVYVSPWGWTWVDDAPWGFAPFHYGRWVYYRNYWGWAPGPIYIRPVYAPALVTWFGGPGWGISFGFGYGGGYGWCPLGWGEPYYPWYRASRGYFHNVNVTNTHITNITNITNNYYNNPPNRFGHQNTQYANLKAPGAITAVPRRTLESGQPVARANVPVSIRQLSGAPRGEIGKVAPTRNSILGPRVDLPTATPPSRVVNRPVMTRIAAPATQRGLEGAQARTPNDASRPADARAAAPNQSGRAVPHSPQTRGTSVAESTPTTRQVPRPPNAENGRSSMDRPNRGDSISTRGGAPVAHPPVVANPRSDNQSAPTPRRVPRPDASTPGVRTSPGEGSRDVPVGRPANRGSMPSAERPRSVQPEVQRDGRGESPRSHFVPRPSGPVLPAPSAGSESGRRTAPVESRSMGDYNGARNYGESRSAQPRYEAPRYDSPRYEGSRNDGPRYDSPRYEAPRSMAPSGPSGRESAPSIRGGNSGGGGNAGRSSAPPNRGNSPRLGR
jgi:hypothetical protein